jgi:hypothetical protein
MENELGKLKELAERYTEAWCSQEAAWVSAFYSPNGSLSVNGGKPAVGRKAIADVAQSFMSAFPDMVITLDELRLRGERTEYHWTLAGTNSGPGGTGKRVRISGFESWKIGADGLIAESQGQFDSAEYERQLKNGV